MHFGSGNVKRTLHVVGTNSLVAEAQPSQTQAHPSNTGLKYTIASRHAWTPGSSENLKKRGRKTSSGHLESRQRVHVRKGTSNRKDTDFRAVESEVNPQAIEIQETE